MDGSVIAPFLALSVVLAYVVVAVFFGVLSSYVIKPGNRHNDDDFLHFLIGVFWPFTVPVVISYLVANSIGRKFA